MQAIEIEVTPEQRQIRLPDVVPSGVTLRVVMMWEPLEDDDEGLKTLIVNTTEGLSEDDLARSRDLGRGEAGWDI
ncbi:hypothetical protein G3480_03550 [Thiorhodococcus mannitoliphagus]|uniref:Uncharacterized protein n=1 Tax=Thiorhodococcus mannitoliphagus TaxID=329406 RepID=A0A6P1DMY4_9GAMM|nr:hypothetical protein [Thiorhodococcus mannitoliphagus]NEX19398.1 hypothetical protein [Thiorhodococcus mannitoliphagus]